MYGIFTYLPENQLNVGRYTSPMDPVGLKGSISTREYVSGGPLPTFPQDHVSWGAKWLDAGCRLQCPNLSLFFFPVVVIFSEGKLCIHISLYVLYICRYVYAVYVDISCKDKRVMYLRPAFFVANFEVRFATGSALVPFEAWILMDVGWLRICATGSISSRLFPVLGCPVGRWDQWLGSMGWLFHLLKIGVFIEVITHWS